MESKGPISIKAATECPPPNPRRFPATNSNTYICTCSERYEDSIRLGRRECVSSLKNVPSYYRKRTEGRPVPLMIRGVVCVM